MSYSTVRTIDDVLSAVETTLSIDASLKDSRKFIQNIAKRDPGLMIDAIDEIESIKSILYPIAQNPEVLVDIMSRTGAVLAGPQATSFFYPLCDWGDAPWDIFCHSSTADDFIVGYRQSSTAEQVEDVNTDDGRRVVHMRKSIAGFATPANIRILVSDTHPLASVLQMKNSYEQSVVTAAGAICFWPKLTSRGMFRVFEDNIGTSCYPRGKTFYTVTLKELKKIKLRKPMGKPEVYIGTDSRIESVIFKNVSNVDHDEHMSAVDMLENIVWAACTNSTRYLGTIGSMQ